MPVYGYGEVAPLVTSSITKSSFRTGVTPRWVREAKRFTQEDHKRIEAHLMEIDKYVYKTFREVIDLQSQVEYSSQVAQERYFELRERMNNK